MSRSKWKGSFISNKHFKKNISNNIYPVMPRNISIQSKFVGLNFKVHNGKDMVEIQITDNMIGYKLGSFVLTRSKYNFKRKKSKK